MTKPFYPNDDDLAAKIEEYFAYCDEGEEVPIVRKHGVHYVKRQIPYTVPGLAVFLGYCSRNSIFDLKQDPAHSGTIKRALTKIEDQRVSKALNGEQESRFAQFDLKNNFGYKDSQEVTNVNLNVQLSDGDLQQRLDLLERKMQLLDNVQDAEVIEGDFQTKLLESLQKP